MRKKSNTELQKLIIELKKTKSKSWATVAKKLERARRRNKAVNLWKINKHTKEGDVVVVPGKVLSEGELDHRVTIAAFSFSAKAKEKLGEKAMSIQDLLKSNKEGKGIKLLV